MQKRNRLCVWLTFLMVMQAGLLCGCAGIMVSRGKRPENSVEQNKASNDSRQGKDVKQSSASGEENHNSLKEAAQDEKETSSEAVVFEGRDMEGNVVSSDILSGSKLTMINVWATYCNPCLNEMPGLGELAQEYDASEFQIIGIISDVQEGADQKMVDLAAELIERTGADYPHLLLNESLYYALLTDVSAVPTTFFLDEKGRILDTVIGSMSKGEWEEMIRAFLER